MGFADFKGNRQMLSTGNLDGNDRVEIHDVFGAHRDERFSRDRIELSDGFGCQDDELPFPAGTKDNGRTVSPLVIERPPDFPARLLIQRHDAGISLQYLCRFCNEI